MEVERKHGEFLGKVNVLGTEYEICRQNARENPKMEEATGLCEQYSKRIVIGSLEDAREDKMCIENLVEFEKKTMRHEIIHAFLGESGLRECSEWAENEEMVDWLSIQFPKLLKAFQDIGAI